MAEVENKPEVKEQPASSRADGKIPITEIFVIPTPIPFIDAGDTGIKYDFNYGCRVCLPKSDRLFFVQITDDDTGLIFWQDNVDCSKESKTITTNQVWFHKYRILVAHADNHAVLLEHVYYPTNKNVMIQCPECGLGDAIGWFSAALKFKEKWNCKLYFCVPDYISSIFKNIYPDITCVNKDHVREIKTYATYYMGLFFGNEMQYQPVDFRMVGIHKHVADILGVSDVEYPPMVDLSAPRQIKEKYVCIAVNASSHCKHWNYPGGWIEVTAYLKSLGYRVLCIDKERVLYRGSGVIEQIPFGCEDFTGDKPLQERINLIKDADFFIGLGSGLAWIAWCCRTPVILISGFSHPSTEFHTKYRVINYGVCNSCWNDLNCKFDHKDPLWCPRHKNDQDAYICTRAITPLMVKRKIDECIADHKPEENNPA